MMAGIGTGFGAFADGMSSAYMAGTQLKRNMSDMQDSGGLGVSSTTAKKKAPAKKEEPGAWSNLAGMIGGDKE